MRSRRFRPCLDVLPLRLNMSGPGDIGGSLGVAELPTSYDNGDDSLLQIGMNGAGSIPIFCGGQYPGHIDPTTPGSGMTTPVIYSPPQTAN